MTRKTVSHPSRHLWLLVGLLALAHLMAFVDRFAMSAIATQLKTTFHLSETELGALQGMAIALPYAAVILPLGRLADRIPPRRLVVAGLVVWSLGGFACAFATSSAQLWAARMLMGVGQAAFTPASLALLAGAFGPGAMARPLSVFTAGSTLGKSVALLAGGAILTLQAASPFLHHLFGAAPWRLVFALTAAPNLLLILAFLFVKPPILKREAEPGALVRARQGNPIITPGFVTFTLVALAPVILIQATAAWTPVFYARFFHLPTSRTAFLLGSILLIAAPAGHLAGGQLTALSLKRGFDPGRLVAACLAIGAPLGVALCFSPSLMVSLCAYGLLVFLLGIAAPAGLTGVSLLAPLDRLGAANAAYMCVATLVGVGLGPTLVGAMSDAWFGGAGGLRFSLLVLLLAVPAACVTIALVCARLWRWYSPARDGGEAGEALAAQ